MLYYLLRMTAFHFLKKEWRGVIIGWLSLVCILFIYLLLPHTNLIGLGRRGDVPSFEKEIVWKNFAWFEQENHNLHSFLEGENNGEEKNANFNLWGVSFGRFDDDVFLDMFAIDPQTGKLLVFKNDGFGNFNEIEDPFPYSPYLEIDSEAFTTVSLWGDYNVDNFDDLVISTTVGILVFENKKIQERNRTSRVLALIQHISSDDVCAGELSWIDLYNDRKLDLVVFCSEEDNTYKDPLFVFQQQGSEGFVSLTTLDIGTPKTHIIFVDTTSLLRVLYKTSSKYEKQIVMVGNRVSNDEEYLVPTLISNNKYHPLNATFRNVYINFCSPKHDIWDNTVLESKCITPSILWDETILFGKLIHQKSGKDEQTDNKFVGKWKNWNNLSFVAKSVSLGDVNNDLEVDITIYGNLMNSVGEHVDSLVLLLTKIQNLEVDEYRPSIIMRETSKNSKENKSLRVFRKGGLKVSKNNSTECDCFGLECVRIHSHVLGDFDNDMDLDMVILDHFRAQNEQECTQISLFSNNGKGKFTLDSYSVVTSKGNSLSSFPSRPSLISVDYNNDGALDFFVVIRGKVFPFLNNIYGTKVLGSANWVEVSVMRTVETPHCIGKMLRMDCKSGGIQLREVYGSSKGSPRIHFGMGYNPSFKRLDVFDDTYADILFGYRDIVGGQVLHLMDIRYFKYPDTSVFEDLSKHPIENLDKCGDSKKVRLTPDFMIIGFWKCGTTGLHNYLTYHPQILPPCTKEVKYFSTSWNNFPHSLNVYLSLFPCGTPNYHHSIDSTPAYAVTKFSPIQIKESLNSTRRFIFCVRNPIDRIYSYFQMMIREERERILDVYKFSLCVLELGEVPEYVGKVCYKDTQVGKLKIKDDIPRPEMFDKIIRSHLIIWQKCLERYSTVERVVFECEPLSQRIFSSSLYYYFFEYWLQFFPRENFLVVDYEQFEDPETFPIIMDGVLNFLELERYTFRPPSPSVISKYEGMLNATRDLLTDFFKEHNEKFYKLSGVDFGW